MSDFQGAQLAFDRQPRDTDGGGGFCLLELSAALAQRVFKRR